MATPCGPLKRASPPVPSAIPGSPALPAKVEATPLKRNLPDDVAGNLGDVNIAACVDRQTVGVSKLRGVTRTIDRICVVAPTGDRANRIRLEYRSLGGQGGGGENQDEDRKEQFFRSS